MTLPPPILAYFTAETKGDDVALINAFAPDAAVKDEGRLHVGRHTIEAWWRAAKAKYQHTVEPLETGVTGDVIRVLARVTGRFPGSPATLTFAFRVEGDQITSLEITA